MTRVNIPTLYVFTEVDGQTRSRACRFGDTRFVIAEAGASHTVEADDVLDVLLAGLGEASERTGSSADLVVVAQCGNDVSPCIIATLSAGRWVDMTHAATPRATSWPDLRDEVLSCLTMLVTSRPAETHEKVSA